MLGNIATLLFTIWAKNNLFRWKSFWSWRICKEAKLSHFRAQKTSTHILKSRRTLFGVDFGRYQAIFNEFLFTKIEEEDNGNIWFLVRILVQSHFSSKMSKEKPLQSMVIIIRPCWPNFCLLKLKRRILATFGFNKTTLRATQPKLFREW